MSNVLLDAEQAALLSALRDNDIPIDDKSRAFAVNTRAQKRCERDRERELGGERERTREEEKQKKTKTRTC